MFSKKLYVGVLLSFLTVALVLVGCSSDSEGASNNDDEVVVDVFQFKVEFKEQFEELADIYEEENPGVKINVSTVGGGSDYASTLKTRISSGEEPAIFNVGGPADVEQYNNLLADLSDTKAAKAAYDSTLTGVTLDGKVVGLPYNQEGYGLIYNKEVLKNAGVDPTSIASFEDLKAAVEKIDSQKKELGVEAVFAFPVKEVWVTGEHLANAFIAPEFDGNVMKAFESDTVEFTNSNQMKAFVDLQNNYSVQPTLSLTYSQQVEELFSTGKVAMIQQGNWVYNTIHEMDPELAENNIGIIPIPLNGEMKMPVGVPMNWAVNKNKDEEVVQAAKDFLDWMYTSETGKEFVLKKFKFIPAYEGYDTSLIADPLSKTIYEYAEAGNTSGWVFGGFPSGWGQQTLGANIQKYIAGEATWDEIVEKSIAEWESARE